MTGAARTRWMRRTLARLEGVPFVPQQVPMFERLDVYVSKAVMAELRIELAAMNKARGTNLTQGEYAALALESAVENERKLREQREAESNLVQTVTAAQVARVLGPAPADFPRPRPVTS